MSFSTLLGLNSLLSYIGGGGGGGGNGGVCGALPHFLCKYIVNALPVINIFKTYCMVSF